MTWGLRCAEGLCDSPAIVRVVATGRQGGRKRGVDLPLCPDHASEWVMRCRAYKGWTVWYGWVGSNPPRTRRRKKKQAPVVPAEYPQLPHLEEG